MAAWQLGSGLGRWRVDVEQQGDRRER